MRLHYQHTPDWCWAACIAMVVEYVNRTRLEDCEVLSLYDRSLGGPGACCEGDRSCVRTGWPGETGRVLQKVFGIAANELDTPLSFDEVKADIDKGQPMIAYMWKTPTNAHAVVISGYRAPDTLMVLDPTNGAHTFPYSVLRSNPRYGEWTQTTLIQTERKRN